MFWKPDLFHSQVKRQRRYLITVQNETQTQSQNQPTGHSWAGVPSNF